MLSSSIQGAGGDGAPKTPQLGFDEFVEILQRCDEPTRDIMVGLSTTMREACAFARRRVVQRLVERPCRWTSEKLPTMIELEDMGCKKPNSRNILATLVPNAETPQIAGSLLYFHHMRAAIDQAIHDDSVIEASSEFRTFLAAGGAAETLFVPFLGMSVMNGFARQHIHHNNSLIEGVYRLGKPCGQNAGKSLGGKERWEGSCMVGDHLHGPGLQLSSDGTRYEGVFTEGKLTGQGTIRSPGGDVYHGEVKENLPDGYGSLRLTGGNEIRGHWRKARLIGGGHWQVEIKFGDQAFPLPS